jgi:hypothetical protein
VRGKQERIYVAMVLACPEVREIVGREVRSRVRRFLHDFCTICKDVPVEDWNGSECGQ